MVFKYITEKFNEEEVGEITLVTIEGDETTISKNDQLKDEGNHIFIIKKDQEIIVSLEKIYKIIVTKKSPTSPQIHSFPRKGMKNRY